MWGLPRQLINTDGSVDGMQRKYCITEWQLTTLDGSQYKVCRSGWKEAMGGSDNAHDDMYYFVLRGHSPSDVEATAGSKQAMKSIIGVMENERTRRGSARRDHAIAFWVGLMRLCDWMPNDQRLVLRGPGYGFYHGSIYGPRATALGLYLSYKVFMACRVDALKIVAAALPGCDPSKMRFGRCERHSKFPECTECQQRREELHSALSNPASTPEFVEEKKRAVLEHQGEWTADREFALALRRSHYLASTSALYECDDKCGSWWQALPVALGGRYSKASATKVYRFAIQSNSISGEDGILRFAFVPKNVSTGGNFGLTNLIMVIWRAYEKGRLQPHVKRLIRHTDGGPDNVTFPTHVLHWLLVYLGIFDSVLWFRFEAGHSHTELADRFFALLKKLFDTDSSTRVGKAVQSFAQLESVLREKFEDFPEAVEVEFNFANWDFESWFKQYDPDDEQSATTKRSPFSRYSFDNVWFYEYHGLSHSQHGGVKVTCKDRLSRVGTAREAEYSPIETVQNADGTKRNVTMVKGIRFMMTPPDLRCSPSMEAYCEKNLDKPSLAARGVPAAFPHLSADSVDDWHALHTLHSQAPHSGALPLLPADVAFTSDSGPVKTRRFTGTPMDLKPMLQRLQRFDRPLITWDIFNAPAPTEFPEKPTTSPVPEEQMADAQPETAESSTAPLRDPRVVNQVVHADYTRAQFNRVSATLSAEEWVCNAPNRIEDSHWEKRDAGGGLYTVLLEVPDGEFFYGLGRDCGPSDEAESRMLQWFGRCSAVHKWPGTVKFDKARWDVKESFPCEGFLLEVNEDKESLDVTDSSTLSQPVLSSHFTERLNKFAGTCAPIFQSGSQTSLRSLAISFMCLLQINGNIEQVNLQRTKLQRTTLPRTTLQSGKPHVPNKQMPATQARMARARGSPVTVLPALSSIQSKGCLMQEKLASRKCCWVPFDTFHPLHVG
jgi:hypothetical protein